jgi:hypothetical protein
MNHANIISKKKQETHSQRAQTNKNFAEENKIKISENSHNSFQESDTLLPIFFLDTVNPCFSLFERIFF